MRNSQEYPPMTFTDRFYHAARPTTWWMRLLGYGRWTQDGWV